MDPAADQGFDQPGLALQHHGLGPRALAEVEIAQPRALGRGGRASFVVARVFADDQAPPVALAAAVEQALAQALAVLELGLASSSVFARSATPASLAGISRSA